MINYLNRIVRNPITYEKDFHLRYQELLSDSQVNYVEDKIVTRDMANLGMSRKEAIQAIPDIVQESSYVQAKNHLDFLIWYNSAAKYEKARASD